MVFNSRGTSGSPVLTAQFYSASFTEDMRWVGGWVGRVGVWCGWVHASLTASAPTAYPQRPAWLGGPLCALAPFPHAARLRPTPLQQRGGSRAESVPRQPAVCGGVVSRGQHHDTLPRWVSFPCGKKVLSSSKGTLYVLILALCVSCGANIMAFYVRGLGLSFFVCIRVRCSRGGAGPHYSGSKERLPSLLTLPA